MSRCTHCDCEMLDSDARICEECPACRLRVVPHKVNRFAAIGRRMPKSRYEQRTPMPWQVVEAYAAAQSGE